MKAVILTDSTQRETSNRRYFTSVFAQLHALGIAYDRYVSSAAPSASTLSADYDLVIIPKPTTNQAKALIDSADLEIPVFVMYYHNATSMLATDPGITGSVTAIADRFVSVPWTESVWNAVYGRSYALSGTGTAILTVQATNPIDDTAQTDADTVCAWSVPTVGSSHMYATSLLHDTQPMMAILMQEACNNGDFSATQISEIRKAPLVVDQDHVNGNVWTNEEVFNRWLDLLPADSITWCGVTNLTGTDLVDDMPQYMIDAFTAETDNRLRFCYHNHDSSWDAITGVWPNTTDVLNEAQQETNWATLEAAWVLQGLAFDEDNGYYNPGGNRWNEDTLKVMQNRGIKMVRNAASDICSRPALDLGSAPVNIHKVRHYMRGVTIVAAADLSLTDVRTTAAEWRVTFQLMMKGIHYGQSIYFHPDDFVDVQDPKTAEYGVEILEQLVALGEYATDTVIAFANPTQYTV